MPLLVSIVVPTYNRADLLPEAIESCLNQTYPHIEVIIVDDGSADGTAEMVQKKIRDQWGGKVRYFFKPNGGTSSAKNLGMSVACGDYIQFLDSDDVLRPDKLERQIEAIHAAGGIVDCCTCYGRLGYLKAGWENAYRIGELCPDVQRYVERQSQRTVHIMHTEAPLWRRDFLQAASAGWREDLSVAEEWEYYIRLLVQRPQLVNMPEDLFWVRHHEGEQLSKSFVSLKHILSFYRAISGVEEMLRPTEFWTSPVRAGLLLRARSSYMCLLRSEETVSLKEYESWLVRLAKSVPDWRVVVFIWLRKIVGKNLLISIFKTIRVS